MFFVCCVLLCVQEVVDSWVSAVGVRHIVLWYCTRCRYKYHSTRYIHNPYQIFGAGIRWEREKNDKSVVLCVLCVVKKVIYYNDFNIGKYKTNI
jgi:hypothetical protein